MKIEYTVPQEDLKVLFVKTRFAYGKITFENWITETKNAYKDFIQGKKDFKTFAQWVNGQIIVL